MSSITDTRTGKSGRQGKKALLQNSVASLKLGEPLRMAHQVENVDAQSASIAAQTPATEAMSAPAGTAHPDSESPILDERRSRTDSVTPSQCQEMPLSERSGNGLKQDQAATVSRHDPVTGARNDSVTKRHCDSATVSRGDSVTTGQNHGVTLSKKSGGIGGERSRVQAPEPEDKRRLPTILKSGVLKPKDHFCAIPGAVLQQGGLFENPYDFMVYLYLFSKSYGFGRNTCDMGLNELVGFTRLARNSVKKSLDRLAAQKWIRMVSNFEYGRVTRKWRVYSPYENGKSPDPTYVNAGSTDPMPADRADGLGARPTGSSPDTVNGRLCHGVPLSGSAGDPVTGSPGDPYKNRIPNNLKNSSFSVNSERLRKYFDELRPIRKRETEWEAFLGIRQDFSETEVADCLEYLEHSGLPGGEPCHSPMAYLARAMSEVLARVRERREVELRRQDAAARRAEEVRRRAEEEARAQQEWAARERAFRHAFAGRNEQEVVAEICRDHGFAAVGGLLARSFAINQWWQANAQVKVGVAL